MTWHELFRSRADMELTGDCRPRVGKNGVHMDREYLRTIAQLTTTYLWAWRQAPPVQGWTQVLLSVVCPRPQQRPASVPADVWSTGERCFRIGKPDGDNAEKVVWDALVKAGVLSDDTQVVSWSGRREYAARGEDAHVEVVVMGWRGER